MKKSLKISLFVFSIFAIVGLASVASANHSWGGYHWARTANSFTLKLGDNVSPAWDSYLTTTSGDWSTSTVLDTSIVAGLTNPKNCKSVLGRVEICSRTYGNNGWLGLAQIWISGSHITQGVVKMNDTYFNTAKYNNPNEKLHVMCQEIGHTFGLDHQSEDGSSQDTCMDYFSNTGANATSSLSTKPNTHDYAQLVSSYSHLDSTTTVNASAPTKGGNNTSEFGANLDNLSEWGKGIRKDAKGRDSVFEKDFGNGNKALTHVFWAE